MLHARVRAHIRRRAPFECTRLYLIAGWTLRVSPAPGAACPRPSGSGLLTAPRSPSSFSPRVSQRNFRARGAACNRAQILWKKCLQLNSCRTCRIMCSQLCAPGDKNTEGKSGCRSGKWKTSARLRVGILPVSENRFWFNFVRARTEDLKVLTVTIFTMLGWRTWRAWLSNCNGIKRQQAAT